MLKCFDFLFVQLMYLGPVSPFKIYFYNYLLMYVYTLFICMSLPVCHSVCAVVGGNVQVLFLPPTIWAQDMKFTLSASVSTPSCPSLIPVLALCLEAIWCSSLSWFYNYLDPLLVVFPWAIVFQG